jgi:sugar phosphate isomerase/epimerase
MEEAWEQLFRLGHILADEAEKHGQTVVVEPLSYTEVNIVNTVEDAAYYAETVHRDSFKILVDFYHFSNNGEDLASLKKHAKLLAHAHFASKVTRTPPRSEEDWAFFTECVRALKEIGYTGGLSFEGRVAETDDLAAILLRMREIERSV